MAYGWTSEYFNQNDSDFNDEKYLKSYQYFVETHINGNFGQLRKMLAAIKKARKYNDLLSYLRGNSIFLRENSEAVLDWVLEN